MALFEEHGGTSVFLVGDMDLAIAHEWGVDPYAVNHVWPLELRDRAVDYMAAKNEYQAHSAKQDDLRARRERAKQAAGG